MEEQGGDFISVFHQCQDFSGGVRLKVAQKVGGLIRFHFIEDVGQLFWWQPGDHFDDFFVFQLFQDVGDVLDGQALQDLALFVFVQVAEDFGLIDGQERLEDDLGFADFVAFQQCVDAFVRGCLPRLRGMFRDRSFVVSFEKNRSSIVAVCLVSRRRFNCQR